MVECMGVSSKFGCHKMHGRVCVSKKKVACGESVSSKCMVESVC
jgi:hypothetical protein